MDIAGLRSYIARLNGSIKTGVNQIIAEHACVADEAALLKAFRDGLN